MSNQERSINYTRCLVTLEEVKFRKYPGRGWEKRAQYVPEPRNSSHFFAAVWKFSINHVNRNWFVIIEHCRIVPPVLRQKTQQYAFGLAECNDRMGSYRSFRLFIADNDTVVKSVSIHICFWICSMGKRNVTLEKVLFTSFNRSC